MTVVDLVDLSGRSQPLFDPEDGHLDDPIIPGAKSRGLQIQEDDGTVELDGEEHQVVWRSVCISL